MPAGSSSRVWCDLRVVAEDATFGVFCRRWGVPLIDGGTVRLPRIVGQGVAMDLILTGRAVAADEALRIGLATRVVAPGRARAEAEALALTLAELPQTCLRQDRLSRVEQEGRDEGAAIAQRVPARAGLHRARRRGRAALPGGGRKPRGDQLDSEARG